MSAVTFDALCKILPTMGREDVAVLVRSVLGVRQPADRTFLVLVDRLKAGLWEFMRATGFVSDAQGRAVLARVEPALKDVAPVYEHGGTTLPFFPVVFAEQRWVAYPLGAAWYDMKFDEEYDELPEPAVLTVTCDVTAMYLRQNRWLAKLGGGKDAGPRHHAPPGGEPRQPGRAGPPVA